MTGSKALVYCFTVIHVGGVMTLIILIYRWGSANDNQDLLENISVVNMCFTDWLSFFLSSCINTVVWKRFFFLFFFYYHFLHICHTWMIQIKQIFYYTKITRVNKKNAGLKEWFHLLREKSYPKLPGTTWKSNCPLNLITGCATLCSNNCNQAFAITGNESFKSLWRNFGPLFFAELF